MMFTITVGREEKLWRSNTARHRIGLTEKSKSKKSRKRSHKKMQWRLGMKFLQKIDPASAA